MEKKIKSLLVFFGITLPLGWIFSIPMILVNWGIISLQIPNIIFSSLTGASPLITLFICEKLYWKDTSAPKLVSQIFKTISFKKKDIFILILSICLIPAVYVLSSYLNFKVGFQTELCFLNPGPGELGWILIIIIPATFVAMLLSSPILEEPGWRGFAIAELDKLMPRIFSSLIVGTYWWLWHQGMNIALDNWPSLFKYVSMVLDSFLIDAFFRKSGYNLLTAMFAHSAYAVGIIYLYSIPQNYIKLCLMICLIIIIYLFPNHKIKTNENAVSETKIKV